MAGLVDITDLPDLTPVAAEAGAAEGDPRPVYTWAGPPVEGRSIVRSYPPSDGGAPRLVVASGSDESIRTDHKLMIRITRRAGFVISRLLGVGVCEDPTRSRTAR
jgi:hypothetical protein